MSFDKPKSESHIHQTLLSSEISISVFPAINSKRCTRKNATNRINDITITPSSNVRSARHGTEGILLCETISVMIRVSSRRDGYLQASELYLYR